MHKNLSFSLMLFFLALSSCATNATDVGDYVLDTWELTDRESTEQTTVSSLFTADSSLRTSSFRTIEYYSRGFANLFQQPAGGCIFPRCIHETLKDLLKTHCPNNQNETYSYVCKNDSLFIISDAAHDLDFDEPNNHIELSTYRTLEQGAGGLHLSLAITNIMNYLSAKNAENSTSPLPVRAEVHIPLVQNNLYSFGMRRAHFVTLKLKIENNVITKAFLFDPRGWLSNICYDSEFYIKKQFEKSGLTNVDIEMYYLGHQGYLNFKDCGRISAAYIEASYYETGNEGHIPEKLTTTEIQEMSAFLELSK